jgi:hypothetical protein
MHQIIAQVNALSFNQSNAGRGSFGGCNRCGCGWDCSSQRIRGQAPTLYKAGQFGAHGGFSPGLPQGVVPHGGNPMAGNLPDLLLWAPPVQYHQCMQGGMVIHPSWPIKHHWHHLIPMLSNVLQIGMSVICVDLM